MEKIRHHVLSKQTWIQRVRARVLARLILPEPTMTSGELHDVFGVAYPLVIYEQTPPAKVIFDGEILHCYVTSRMDVVKRKALLVRWYKQHMQLFIPAMIKKWEPVMGVRVHSWGIRSMKSRWGSCHIHTRHISLNLHLIKKPRACLEYVIVHEMVHLLEANHGPRFYALMNRFMPEWKDYQKKLVANSDGLL